LDGRWLSAGEPTPRDSGATDAVDVYAEGSGLSYDPQSQQYNYVWQTQKAWAGKCGELKIVLIDGTLHEAEFKFM
jgi:hypothetical protein